VIIGDFTSGEAEDLALLIRAGALPVPVEVVEQRTVGPTLGDAAIKASVQAAVLGATLTILYMIAAVVMRTQPWLAGKAGTEGAPSPLPARSRRYCMTVLQVTVDKLVAGRTATRHDHQSPSTQFRGEALPLRTNLPG
jgi:hypothetical protein